MRHRPGCLPGRPIPLHGVRFGATCRGWRVRNEGRPDLVSGWNTSASLRLPALVRPKYRPPAHACPPRWLAMHADEIRRLFEYEHWVTSRILASAANIPAADFVHDLAAFARGRGIRSTLVH